MIFLYLLFKYFFKYLYNCGILQTFGESKCWAKLLLSWLRCDFLFFVSSNLGGSGTLKEILLLLSCKIGFPWGIACLFLSVLDGKGNCLLHCTADSAISSAIAENAVCGAVLGKRGTNLRPSWAQSSEDAEWPVTLEELCCPHIYIKVYCTYW